jgi:hypothetical protein
MVPTRYQLFRSRIDTDQEVVAIAVAYCFDRREERDIVLLTEQGVSNPLAWEAAARDFVNWHRGKSIGDSVSIENSVPKGLERGYQQLDQGQLDPLLSEARKLLGSENVGYLST